MGHFYLNLTLIFEIKPKEFLTECANKKPTALAGASSIIKTGHPKNLSIRKLDKVQRKEIG